MKIFSFLMKMVGILSEKQTQQTIKLKKKWNTVFNSLVKILIYLNNLKHPKLKPLGTLIKSLGIGSKTNVLIEACGLIKIGFISSSVLWNGTGSIKNNRNEKLRLRFDFLMLKKK